MVSCGFSLAVIALFFSAAAPRSFAEDLVIGGPEIPESFNIADGSHPLATVARDSLCETLTQRTKGGPAAGVSYQLNLSDSMNAKGEGTFWSVRLKEGAKFTSGAEITAADLAWSLRRCKDTGTLRMVSKIEISPPGSHPPGEKWVDLHIGRPGGKHLNNFPELLAACPIYQKQAAEIFGDSFGTGANLVCSGSYKLTGIRPGRAIELVRSAPGRGNLTAAELRGFEDPENGLSALRAGRIALFFTTDHAVLDKGSQDPTLKSGNCLGDSYLARRSLEVNCDSNLSLVNMVWR